MIEIKLKVASPSDAAVVIAAVIAGLDDKKKVEFEVVNVPTAKPRELQVIKQLKPLEGHTPVKQWANKNKAKLSTQLFNILSGHYDPKGAIGVPLTFVETVSKKQFKSHKFAGDKSWAELQSVMRMTQKQATD